MKCSWLLPSYKSNPEWLKQCLQSCIDQKTKDEWEIILVNDGDPEFKTEDYQPMSDKLKIINLATNKGVAGALNAGLEHCSGEWIARIDSDDWNESNRLKKQIKFAEENNYDACGSGFYAFGEIKVPGPEYADLKKHLENRRVPIWHPTALIKRSKLIEAKGYPTNVSFAEDLGLWIKAYERGWKIGNCEDYLVHYRNHDNQVSRIKFKQQRDGADKALRIWHEFRLDFKGTPTA